MGGVTFVAPADAGYVLRWSLPDEGFLPKMATSLTNQNWTNLAFPIVQIGAEREMQIPKSALTGNEAYFML